MEKQLQDGWVRLVNADSLAFIKTLPAASVDLIATDPPYFGVKQEAWDNQWESAAAFLAWLDAFLVEFRRVLKPNGSVYLFCSPRMNADVEMLIRDRFRVLNHIVWAKPSGVWNRMRKADMRAFWPASERIIFAEQVGANTGSGYTKACLALRRQVFAPLIDYFRQARERAGISVADINRVTGSKMAGHWFGASQWQLPSEAHYAQLQQLFAAQHPGGRPDAAPLGESYQGLHHTYHELMASYEALRAQYEQLRRPFSVTPDVPFTDVWLYPSVQAYPGKHPCEKPLAMMEHIIRTSSRPGDVVADFFMGSGSTGKAAIRLGRRFIGVELETPRYEQTCREVEALLTTTGAAHALETNSDDVTSCPDG